MKDLDKNPSEGVLPPLVLYHRILRNTSATGVVTDLLSLISRSRLVEKDANTEAIYPAIFELLSETSALTQIQSSLGKMDLWESQALIKWLTEAFEPDRKNLESGWQTHLKFLRMLLLENKEGFLNLSQRFQPIYQVWKNLSLSETQFAFHFVHHGGYERLSHILRNQTSRQTLQRLLQDLSLLSQNGSLHRAFQLLTWIQDTQVKKLAKELVEWTETGEFASAIATLQLLNSP